MAKVCIIKHLSDWIIVKLLYIVTISSLLWSLFLPYFSPILPLNFFGKISLFLSFWGIVFLVISICHLFIGRIKESIILGFIGCGIFGIFIFYKLCIFLMQEPPISIPNLGLYLGIISWICLLDIQMNLIGIAFGEEYIGFKANFILWIMASGIFLVLFFFNALKDYIYLIIIVIASILILSTCLVRAKSRRRLKHSGILSEEERSMDRVYKIIRSEYIRRGEAYPIEIIERELIKATQLSKSNVYALLETLAKKDMDISIIEEVEKFGKPIKMIDFVSVTERFEKKDIAQQKARKYLSERLFETALEKESKTSRLRVDMEADQPKDSFISSLTTNFSKKQRDEELRQRKLKNQESNIFFSVYTPRSIMPARKFTLNVWVYLKEQKPEMFIRASRPGHKEIVEKGPVPVKRRELIQMRLVLPPPFIVKNDTDHIIWIEKVSNAQFIVSVSEDAAIGTEEEGEVIIYIGGMEVLRIKFIIEIGASVEDRDRFSMAEATSFIQRIKKVFTSYARFDQMKVLLAVQGLRAIGIEVFLDNLSIKQGEKWEKKIYENILNSDLFLLFWSNAAMRSFWVDKEWNFAYENRGPDFIKPVPLEDPKTAPPPEKISSKHFEDETRIYQEYLELKARYKLMESLIEKTIKRINQLFETSRNRFDLRLLRDILPWGEKEFYRQIRNLANQIELEHQNFQKKRRKKEEKRKKKKREYLIFINYERDFLFINNEIKEEFMIKLTRALLQA